jgi:hypothetical protein
MAPWRRDLLVFFVACVALIMVEVVFNIVFRA